jgi:enoyl-CoA hydratase
VTNYGAYTNYRHLNIDNDGAGTLVITINRPEVLNAANERLHWELGEIWRTFDEDPTSRVAVITGTGRAFSAGGDLEMIKRATVDIAEVKRQHKQTAAIVENMARTDKPIVSAINGTAVGAGLAVALLADVSIVAENAKITDGHMRLGVAAGDHAVMMWPLLCGLAKAKYYLLTADFISGAEAERIGLVSRCAPEPDVMPLALDIARRMASGPQTALQWTKRSLNQWLKLVDPIFQHSLALEMLSLLDDDVKEGVDALVNRRPASFPTALSFFESPEPP